MNHQLSQPSNVNGPSSSASAWISPTNNSKFFSTAMKVDSTSKRLPFLLQYGQLLGLFFIRCCCLYWHLIYFQRLRPMTQILVHIFPPCSSILPTSTASCFVQKTNMYRRETNDWQYSQNNQILFLSSVCVRGYMRWCDLLFFSVEVVVSLMIDLSLSIYLDVSFDDICCR